MVALVTPRQAPSAKPKSRNAKIKVSIVSQLIRLRAGHSYAYLNVHLTSSIRSGAGRQLALGNIMGQALN